MHLDESSNICGVKESVPISQPNYVLSSKRELTDIKAMIILRFFVPFFGVSDDPIFADRRRFTELRRIRSIKIEANHPCSLTVQDFAFSSLVHFFGRCREM